MERYQGNLMIEDIIIGNEYENIQTKLKSKVINKTGNSIEVYSKAITKDGISCKNWYEISGFNRMFK